MPSSMTHTYFALEVKEKLPSFCQNKIQGKLEYFKLFSQGSDPFMFYHFLLGKKAKKVRSIQSTMHHKDTKNFFLSTIKYIHENHLVNDGEAMAFLYGYICHYYLDLNAHPYIFYKSGRFCKNDPNTYKYNTVHQEIEYKIDLYLIKKKENIPPHCFKIYKEIFRINNFAPNLQKLIQSSIEQTYHFKNVVPLYLKSIKYMKLFFRLANYDPTGIKLKIYKTIDKITPPSTTRFQVLSYHNAFQDNLSYLNLEHTPWNYPWDQTEQFTTSFLDLYNKAMKDAVKTITTITKMLENKKIDTKVLNQIFQDLSFSTGRPCKEKLDFKYFEF